VKEDGNNGNKLSGGDLISSQNPPGGGRFLSRRIYFATPVSREHIPLNLNYGKKTSFIDLLLLAAGFPLGSTD